MSFLSWGDIFTLPLGGDRIMELRHLRINELDKLRGTHIESLPKAVLQYDKTFVIPAPPFSRTTFPQS